MYSLEAFMENLKAKNPGEPEFVQAAHEVVASIIDVVNNTPEYLEAKLLDRIVEPDRIFTFKVEWEDDNHEVQVNRGYRVQFNHVLGPYKGGLRFHPSVTLGTLKFLGFEQIFKNSLTCLPLGGGKGGSDFNPQGKSDAEIRRFCRAFMLELQKYIGPEIDVPAGDIGVGGREIAYMYNMYKQIRNEHTGVLTGKGQGWGGSILRPEATGFGAIYFAEQMLAIHGESLQGKTVSISGFGNVAWGVAQKATALGAKVVAISGPDGYVYDPDGVNTQEKWDYMVELRTSNNNVVAPYAEKYGCTFVAGKKPWEVPVDIAMPCAIQNELNLNDAKTLVANGVKFVLETSNMGCTADAVEYFIETKTPFAPGKAVNAGGVATSGLEMSQNSEKLYWTAEEVDIRLKEIMKNIHESCYAEGVDLSAKYVNYVKGANIAGFKKVADAMVALGF